MFLFILTDLAFFNLVVSRVLGFLNFIGQTVECSGQPIPEWEEARKMGKSYCSYCDVLTPRARLGVEIHSFFKNFALST